MGRTKQQIEKDWIGQNAYLLLSLYGIMLHLRGTMPVSMANAKRRDKGKLKRLPKKRKV